MSRLDDAIANVSYILDALITLRDIRKSGNCNVCDNKKKCTYVPKPGQLSRFNCPFFVHKDLKTEANKNDGKENMERV